MNPIARATITVALAGAVIGWGPQALAQNRGRVQSSLLLLIDASGSMGDAIGSGNSQVKIEAAKQAAIAALGRAAQSGSVEVAVLAFSGECQDPVPRYQDFTRDVNRLTQFIGSLQPGGGTPMADALLFANRYMEQNGDAGASTRMIMLLADGQNDCGDVGQAMASLKSGGIVFRHETVGFGITPNSQAAQDLRQIATHTGGPTTMPSTPTSSRTCSWSSWTRLPSSTCWGCLAAAVRLQRRQPGKANRRRNRRQTPRRRLPLRRRDRSPTCSACSNPNSPPRSLRTRLSSTLPSPPRLVSGNTRRDRGSGGTTPPDGAAVPAMMREWRLRRRVAEVPDGSAGQREYLP